MPLQLAINTKTHLEQYQESDDPIYYKWSPEEWEFSSEGEDVFRTISQELTRESLSEQSDKKHSAFVESVFKCCVESLKELKKEGLFNDSPDAVIMFSVFDYDEDTECERIEQLNTIELSEEFCNWI